MKRNMDYQSLRRNARIAGALYLVIIICAGFSEGYVRDTLIVPGNASMTLQNIGASELLFRVGFVSDLIAFISDAAVAVLLYVLLKPVSSTLSLLAASLRLLAHPAIASINLLNQFIILPLVQDGGYASAIDIAQRQALSMLFLDAHHYGYLIGGAFFGAHCLLLGYLLYKSDFFPGVLGILIFIAGAAYLLESMGSFLFPAHETLFTWIVVVPAVIAEFSLCLWLLIRGVRSPADDRGQGTSPA